MSPKSLLRHPACVSPIEGLLAGRFHEILDDPYARREAHRLILCSGKIYYDLQAQREADGVDDTALVRIEQLYPFHEDAMGKIQGRYKNIEQVIWVQEEPQNRGAWTFMFPRLLERFPNTPVRYVGREASASPATGSLRIHKEEQEEIVRLALQDGKGHIRVAK
jgi:2-oxoglutarate dehydrogenase E1 component